MNTLTLKDYIRYLDFRLGMLDKDTLSKQESEEYVEIKRNLDQAMILPDYMLNSALISDQEFYESETLKNIAKIKFELSQASETNKKQGWDFSRSIQKLRIGFKRHSRGVLYFIFAIAGLIVLFAVLSSASISQFGEFLSGAGGMGDSQDQNLPIGATEYVSIIVPFVFLIILIYYLSKKK